MRRPVSMRFACRWAAAVLVACCCAEGLAVQRPWQDAAFSLYAANEPLVDVLKKFAANFGLRADLEPGFDGLVNGRFNVASPTEFMNDLAAAYGFDWFVHAGTLSVSHASSRVTKAIRIGGSRGAGHAGSLRQALADLGVIDERFGWGELPDQGLAMVAGPPRYVSLIEETLAKLPATANDSQDVVVFRLRHASVDDRTITYRDGEIMTPGVATVLRGLVGAGDVGQMPRGAHATGASGSQPMFDPERQPAATSVTPGGAGSLDAAPGRGGPAILADPRLNAVIVRDTAERMPIYERLIAQLDAPTPLIGIEALIIDVNSQRLDDLGIAWNAVAKGSFAAGYGDVTTPIDGNTLAIVSGPSRGGATPATTAFTGAASYLIARLRLLEQRGEASIQARPSILTMDNLGALIDLSETFYIKTTGERVASVTPVTVGTTLRVTPRRVVQGGQEVVRLVVDIEDGQIEDRVVDTLPTVRRGLVSTQAVVRQDEALLLGGYKTEQDIGTRSKVPILGDLPGLGLLFSSSTRDVQKRERLFLIRPKIVGVPDSNGVMHYTDAHEPVRADGEDAPDRGLPSAEPR